MSGWAPVERWETEQPLRCDVCGEAYQGRELLYMPSSCLQGGCPGSPLARWVEVVPVSELEAARGALLSVMEEKARLEAQAGIEERLAQGESLARVSRERDELSERIMVMNEYRRGEREVRREDLARALDALEALHKAYRAALVSDDDEWVLIPPDLREDDEAAALLAEHGRGG